MFQVYLFDFLIYLASYSSRCRAVRHVCRSLIGHLSISVIIKGKEKLDNLGKKKLQKLWAAPGIELRFFFCISYLIFKITPPPELQSTVEVKSFDQGRPVEPRGGTFI